VPFARSEPMKLRTLRRRPQVQGTDSLPQDLHPVLRRVYRARRIEDSAELDRRLSGLIRVDDLTGIEHAAALLAQAVVVRARILVVGDFDADGATSCALAVRLLRAMGAAHVDYLVPNRFEFGYGLTPEIVEVAVDRRPDLLITVDNGIASLDGVAAARQRGWQVLITDHHLPGRQLPAADAIVNPNLQGDRFPSKNLAGVGVIFYVLAALRAELRERGWFEAQNLDAPNMAGYLDLVAVGTVADVVPLDRNNRILVAQGLQRVRRRECVPGVQALLAVAGRDVEKVTAADLGFAVGPRLNAAGRLEDMSIGIECLLTDEPGQARELAVVLDGMNQERRGIEARMKDQAQCVVESMTGLDREDLPYGLCLYDPQWHQGVVGIVAARIREQYHRPVIAFAPGGDGCIKGSARSVRGLHIRDALDGVATRNPGMVGKFGGHAMAAGLTLEADRFEQFSAAFDQEVRRRCGPEDLEDVLFTDGEVGSEALTLELAALLRDAGPWGQAFPEPVFDGEFDVLRQKVVGEHHLKMTLRPEPGGGQVDAIAFRLDEERLNIAHERIRAAYRMDVNHYAGRTRLQLVVEYFEPV